MINQLPGPGLCKFNNSLLEDEKYVELIRKNYIIISEKYRGLENKSLKWELTKIELRAKKAKKAREKETNIQKKMEELDKLISNPANTDHLIRQWKTEYIMLKEDLCLLYENKAKGAIIRSKTKWIEQGEKPNKFIVF